MDSEVRALLPLLVSATKRGRFSGLVPTRTCLDPVSGRALLLLDDAPGPPWPGFGEALSRFEEAITMAGEATTGSPPTRDEDEDGDVRHVQQQHRRGPATIDEWVRPPRPRPAPAPAPAPPATRLAPLFVPPIRPPPPPPVPRLRPSPPSTRQQQVYVGDVLPHTFPPPVRARMYVVPFAVLYPAGTPPPSTTTVRSLAQEILLWVRPPHDLRVRCNVALRQACALSLETGLRVTALLVHVVPPPPYCVGTSSPHDQALNRAVARFQRALLREVGVHLVRLRVPRESDTPSVLANWTRKHRTLAVFTSDAYGPDEDRMLVATTRLCRAWHCPVFALDSDFVAPLRAARGLLESAKMQQHHHQQQPGGGGGDELSLDSHEAHVAFLRQRLQSHRAHLVEVVGNATPLTQASAVSHNPPMVDEEITNRWPVMEAVEGEEEEGETTLAAAPPAHVLLSQVRLGVVSPLQVLLDVNDTMHGNQEQELLTRERLCWLAWDGAVLKVVQPSQHDRPANANLVFPGDVAKGQTGHTAFDELQRALVTCHAFPSLAQLRTWCRLLARDGVAGGHGESPRVVAWTLLRAHLVGHSSLDVARVVDEEFL